MQSFPSQPIVRDPRKENFFQQQLIEEKCEEILFFVGISHFSKTALSEFPANGGLRIFPYSSKEAAMKSCKRLAELMQIKHQLYGTHFSGAKIVVWSDPNLVNKNLLFQSIAKVLNRFAGTLYTGCDVNTTNQDMEKLSEFTPYILSSLHCDIDGSVATAYGVFGSIRAVFQGSFRHKRILVVGTGKVGATVATLLSSVSCHVFCFDVIASRAEIPGCSNVSGEEKPFGKQYDMIVICSAKDPITMEMTSTLKTSFLLGSTNELFENESVNHDLASRGILCLPSVVSSAGAVICDSIEMYNPIIFRQTQASILYQFVEEKIFQKTSQILKAIFEQHKIPSAHQLFQQLSQFYESVSDCCGKSFQ